MIFNKNFINYLKENESTESINYGFLMLNIYNKKEELSLQGYKRRKNIITKRFSEAKLLLTDLLLNKKKNISLH